MSQAASCFFSWPCSWTQETLFCARVLAIRLGISLRRGAAPTRRPSASVPDSRGAVSDDCPSAELAARLAQRPIPAPNNSLLPMRLFIGVLLPTFHLAIALT